MAHFERYIGIDYSGAETPTSSLPSLCVYAADAAAEPAEIRPPPSPRKHWTRRGIAEWLVAELRSGPATLVGIDHAFSFPLQYFEANGLVPEWATSSTTDILRRRVASPDVLPTVGRCLVENVTRSGRNGRPWNRSFPCLRVVNWPIRYGSGIERQTRRRSERSWPNLSRSVAITRSQRFEF